MAKQHQTLSHLSLLPTMLATSCDSSPSFRLPQAGCDEFGVPADHSGHRSGPRRFASFRSYFKLANHGNSKDTMANDTAGCQRAAGSGTQILHGPMVTEWRIKRWSLEIWADSTSRNSFETVTVHPLRCLWQITSFITALESLYMQGSDLSAKGFEDLNLGLNCNNL